MITEELDDYILAHIDEEPELLRRLSRDTYVNIMRPRMLSGHLQGRILKMFCRMVRPQKVLELGTFTGYSAQCFAEGLPEGGKIITIDHNDELEEFTRRYLEQSPYKDKIRYIIGDALEEIAKLPDTDFDLVFIDADKRDYLPYYEAVLPKMSRGGFILADNTLWDGKVIDPASQKEQQTRGIVRFNDFVAKDSRVEKVIVPLRDGLTILMKK